MTAVATREKFAKPMDIDDPWFGEDIADIVEAVSPPDRFYMAITQCQVRKKVGSIIIPGKAVEDQEWTHGLGIVVKVGPAVYEGRRFADIGLSKETHGFKPGDLVHFNAGASPRRAYFDGRLFLYITDDAVISRPDRRFVHRMSFHENY